ncbi:hypothetical protein BASA61_000136 [Batrachochytrium salamandrivorans]|nr:hypothetical protein BASA61_000136 [Batrachochytrium salamandrivorans]
MQIGKSIFKKRASVLSSSDFIVEPPAVIHHRFSQTTVIENGGEEKQSKLKCIKTKILYTIKRIGAICCLLARKNSEPGEQKATTEIALQNMSEHNEASQASLVSFTLPESLVAPMAALAVKSAKPAPICLVRQKVISGNIDQAVDNALHEAQNAAPTTQPSHVRTSNEPCLPPPLLPPSTTTTTMRCWKDLRILRKLDDGLTARVFVARGRTKPVRNVALKVMCKQNLIEKGLMEQIQQERHILEELRHSLIIHLHSSFETHSKLVYVFEYAEGGTLHDLLAWKKILTEKQAQFYIAELVEAIGYMHEHRIIHRDLKPDNVLLSQSGHIKLADFGMSARIDSIETSGSGGTILFMAPEALRDNIYSTGVDWWALGTIAYSMVTGRLAYYGDSREEMLKDIDYNDIFHGQIPEGPMSDFLRSLLETNPYKRLGYYFDQAEIKVHAWFSDIDWKQVPTLGLVPPILPRTYSYSPMSWSAYVHKPWRKILEAEEMK